MTDLQETLLQIARRRSISFRREARQLGLPEADVRRAITALRSKKLIYPTARNTRVFHGAIPAEYCAT